MARPVWKGTLAFGLVSIPVEMFTAVRDLGPHFHFLRRSDKSRIGYQKVAKEDGQVVSKDELVKGYEYRKGHYIVLNESDFESAAVKRNSRIDLLDFVAGDEVDDRYFDTPYYLLPGRGGEKAYTLLREALRESGRIGIAKVVMRSKPHLAGIEAIKDALVLSTMRFREELVPVTSTTFRTSRCASPRCRWRTSSSRHSSRHGIPRSTRTSTAPTCWPSSKRGRSGRRRICSGRSPKPTPRWST